MPRKSISQKITDRLTIGRSIVSDEFEISDPGQLETVCHEFIRVDKTIKTLELQRETLKQAILNTPGIDSDQLVELKLAYRRKRISRISVWLNRFSYNIEKLFKILNPHHLDAFKENVGEGTAFRVTIHSTQKTRKSDMAQFEKFIKDKYPRAEIVSYAMSPLEPIIDEEGLRLYCSLNQIPLTGTREPVYNFRVETP